MKKQKQNKIKQKTKQNKTKTKTKQNKTKNQNKTKPKQNKNKKTHSGHPAHDCMQTMFSPGLHLHIHDLNFKYLRPPGFI